MNYKTFLAGVLAGFGVAAVFMPRLVRNVIEETNMVNENGHIARHQETKSILNSKLNNHDYKDSYTETNA